MFRWHALSINTMLSNIKPQVNVLFYWISQKKPSKITCTARHETIIVAPRIHDRFLVFKLESELFLISHNALHLK